MNVIFDPRNPAHRQAFRLMVAKGRQSDLRFDIEGFQDIPTMMMYKMALFGAGALDKLYPEAREVAKVPQKKIHLKLVGSR